MYNLLSDTISENRDELSFSGNYVAFAQVTDVDDGIRFHVFEKETGGVSWETQEKYEQADDTERRQMDKIIADLAAKTGRGWNGTRRDVLDAFLSQLH